MEGKKYGIQKQFQTKLKERKNVVPGVGLVCSGTGFFSSGPKYVPPFSKHSSASIRSRAARDLNTKPRAPVSSTDSAKLRDSCMVKIKMGELTPSFVS